MDNSGEDFTSLLDGLGEIDFEADDIELDDGPDYDDDGDYGDGEEITSPEQLAEIQAKIEAKRFEPKPFVLKPTKKIIAVVDSETDPFENGLVVEPFCIGFDTGDRYVEFWGDDCVKQFFEYLATLTAEGYEFIIYAHNGGKFDFFFFLPYLDEGQSPLIMGGRLVKIFFGKQEFRDSYSIIPRALSTYKKDEIDYDKMKRNRRDKHKSEILSYMRSDCAYTRELVIGFHEMFGDKLTVASAAFSMLNSFHGFERFKSEALDERFRRYYYGGRNQCFETGRLRPNWGKKFLFIDRNSMYSAVMMDEMHPISATCRLQTSIDDNTDFACIEAINDGALPTRLDHGGLDFTIKRGTFYATIHEIKAGLETGTLKILRVKHAWAFDRKAKFSEFVHHFSEKKIEAELEGDAVRRGLYKDCLNAPYGKFALNPRKFRQWTMTLGEVPVPQASADNPDGWILDSQSGDIFIWSRPSPRRNGFINVATAASITGGARANLLRNLAISSRPIYCDTDSILCEGFRGELDATKLGGWKLEATGDRAAIGGKKLYAVFNEGEEIKRASKGVRLTAAEIVSVCDGREIIFENPVPNFKLDGSAEFVSRRINMTGVR